MFFPMIFMEFQVTVNSVVFCSAKKPTTLLTVTTLLRTTLLTVESIVKSKSYEILKGPITVIKTPE